MVNTPLKYNYNELSKIAGKNDETFIILLYSVYKEKQLLASSVNQILKLLNLKDRLSCLHLIWDKYIVEDKKGFLRSGNKIPAEQQNIIHNISFIYDQKTTAKQKREYCYLLSLRHPLKNYWTIPDFFVDPHYYTNPYVIHLQGKLIFIKEHHEILEQHQLKHFSRRRT